MGSNPQGATSSITHELDDLFQSSSTESSSPKFTFHIEEEIFVISDDQDDDPDGSSAAPTLPTPLIWSSTLQVPSATVQEQRVQFRPGHRRSRQTVTLDLREVSAISSDTFRDSSLSSGSDMSPTSSSGTSPRPSRSRIPIRSHLVAASTPVPAPAPEQSSQSSSAPPSPIDRITAHYSTPRDRILHPRPLNFHVATAATGYQYTQNSVSSWSGYITGSNRVPTSIAFLSRKIAYKDVVLQPCKIYHAYCAG
ncbi:hypothetical protein EDD11_006533 [Mortierella claussenii]|nr:hypothetical protein EDD11_006533 [Mortierella claussenii]